MRLGRCVQPDGDASCEAEIALDAQHGPKMAAICSKLAPRWSNMVSRWLKTASRWPKMAQDGFKMTPRWPKMAPRWLQHPHDLQNYPRRPKIDPIPTNSLCNVFDKSQLTDFPLFYTIYKLSDQEIKMIQRISPIQKPGIT
jgi:hypothetical protein